MNQQEIDLRIVKAKEAAVERRAVREREKEYRRRFCESTQEGWDVTYNHLRYNGTGKLRRFVRGTTKWRPTEFGGMTTCIAIHRESGIMLTGYGVCDRSDRFTYADGRWYAWEKIADELMLRTARKDLGLDMALAKKMAKLAGMVKLAKRSTNV